MKQERHSHNKGTIGFAFYRGMTGMKRTVPIVLMAIAFVAFAVRIALADTLHGYVADQQFFIGWMKTLKEHGLARAYEFDPTLNYPPMFPAILYVYKIWADFTGMRIEPMSVAVRFPSIVFDMAAIAAFVGMSRTLTAGKRLFVAAFVAFNPAFAYESAVWGQVDMLHSLLMLLSVWCLAQRPAWAGALFAAALLAKFQAIVIAPVLGMYLLLRLFRNRDWPSLVRFGLGLIAPLGATLGFFALVGSLEAMLYNAYYSAVGFYPQASLNAFNIWYRVMGIQPDTPDTLELMPGITLKRIGLLLLFVAVAYICIYLFKSSRLQRPQLLKAATLLTFAFYMLPTQMHERYVFPAVVFAAAVYVVDGNWLKLASGLSVATFFALLFVVNELQYDDPAGTMWVVYANCAMLIWIAAALGKETGIAPT